MVHILEYNLDILIIRIFNKKKKKKYCNALLKFRFRL